MPPEKKDKSHGAPDGILSLLATIQNQLNSGQEKFGEFDEKLDKVIGDFEKRLAALEAKPDSRKATPASNLPATAVELLIDMDKGQRQVRRFIFRLAIYGLLFFAFFGMIVTATGLKGGAVLGYIAEWLKR